MFNERNQSTNIENDLNNMIKKYLSHSLCLICQNNPPFNLEERNHYQNNTKIYAISNFIIKGSQSNYLRHKYLHFIYKMRKFIMLLILLKDF